MRNLKLLGFAVMAAMASMASATPSASATALYNGPTPLGSGSVLDFSIPSSGSVVLVDTEGGELDKCSTSTVKTTLSSAATGSNGELTWGNCTFPTSTLTQGKLEFVWIGGTTGAVVADAEIGVTINTVFFGTCVYGVEKGTDLGIVTTFSSGSATFHFKPVVKKFSGSNFACPQTGQWLGTYTSTEPTNLRVHGG